MIILSYESEYGRKFLIELEFKLNKIYVYDNKLQLQCTTETLNT